MKIIPNTKFIEMKRSDQGGFIYVHYKYRNEIYLACYNSYGRFSHWSIINKGEDPNELPPNKIML